MAVKNLQIYQERRRRLAGMIGHKGIIFVPGAMPVSRNSDVEYPFRQESSFLYLTGFTEPDALLVMTGGRNPHSIFFCNPKDREREIWTGKRFGPAGAKKVFGFDQAFVNTDMDQAAREIARSLHGRTAIYYPEHRDIGVSLCDFIKESLSYNEARNPPTFLDSDSLIDEMRLLKDACEIETMTNAVDISASAHREILTLVRAGMTEIELEAEFTYRFRKAGGDPCHAYPPIIATGKHACTLHHVSTNTRIKEGDLVLVDAGCEYEGYASDITRTFPASGTFSPEQRAIYAIVLAAQKAAIAKAEPGAPLYRVHDTATKLIYEGLMDLGLLEKIPLKDAMRNEHGKHLFPHGTSHWLGLDVHDVGDYMRKADGRAHRMLEPGMVLTIEPGIYIQPNAPKIEKRWRGIGVRIEDDLLITEAGNVVLSANAPKEIEDIEAIMASKRTR